MIFGGDGDGAARDGSGWRTTSHKNISAEVGFYTFLPSLKSRIYDEFESRVSGCDTAWNDPPRAGGADPIKSRGSMAAELGTEQTSLTTSYITSFLYLT